MGLELLRRDSHTARRYPSLVNRHIRPCPRFQVGRFLASHHCASSLIDISDGLSTDLHHLCEQSQVGAVIDTEKVPIAKTSKRLRSLLSGAPLHYALNGGEDYELLFTVSPKLKSRIPTSVNGIPIHEIGWITKETGRCSLLERGRLKNLSPAGFDHFAASHRLG